MKRVYAKGKFKSFSTAKEQGDVTREASLLLENEFKPNKANPADRFAPADARRLCLKE